MNTLYVFLDGDETPLYVGITVNLERRIKQHMLGKAGAWSEVKRIDLTHFDTAKAMHRAERELIALLQPP